MKIETYKVKSPLNSAHVLWIQCQSVAPLFLSRKVIPLNIKVNLLKVERILGKF